MARTPLQRTLLAARLLFLGGSLGGVGYYTLLATAPAWVDAKRDRWVQKDTWELDDTVQRLERLANRNPDANLPALEQFVRDLGNIRPEDRVMPIARRALAAIARIEENRGNDAAAIAAVARSLVLQPNDLPGQTQHARLLCKSQATQAEGLFRLRELNRQLPEVSFIADALAGELRRGGDVAGAFEALAALDASAPLSTWRVRPLDFPHFMEMSARPSGEGLTMTFGIPGGMDGFFLEPPAYIGMRVSGARIRATNQAGSAEVPLVDVVTKLHGLNRVGADLHPLWNVHGHIEIRIPHLPPAWEHTITITANVELAPSPGMLDLAADPRAMPLARERAAAGDPAMLTAIERARARAHPLAEFEFYWADGDGFSAERNAKTLGMVQAFEGELRFEAVGAPQGNARIIRLDFPMPGPEPREFTLQHIEVVDATGVIDVPVTADSYQEVNQMRRTANGLVASGSDPYVVLKLPRRAEGLQRATARGTTR